MTHHYLIQCRPSSMMDMCITWPHWVNRLQVSSQIELSLSVKSNLQLSFHDTQFIIWNIFWKLWPFRFQILYMYMEAKPTKFGYDFLYFFLPNDILNDQWYSTESLRTSDGWSSHDTDVHNRPVKWDIIKWWLVWYWNIIEQIKLT